MITIPDEWRTRSVINFLCLQCVEIEIVYNEADATHPSENHCFLFSFRQTFWERMKQFQGRRSRRPASRQQIEILNTRYATTKEENNLSISFNGMKQKMPYTSTHTHIQRTGRPKISVRTFALLYIFVTRCVFFSLLRRFAGMGCFECVINIRTGAFINSCEIYLALIL